MANLASFKAYLEEQGITDEIIEPVYTEQPEQYIRDWKNDGIVAADLQYKVFPEIRWIVKRILPAGCALLAGRPKSKKSWLALNLALAVANGSQALGSFDVDQGDVLYLDLESNQRRMKNRIHKIVGDAPWSERLHIFNSWSRGREAIGMLEAWVIQHPETRLIVGDVFINLRPERQRGGDPYAEDTDIMQQFSQFAAYHNVSILLLHHTRKTQSKGGSPFDDVLGTIGVQGGVDTLIKMEQDIGGSQLTMIGRDIEDDRPLPIKWEPQTCSWQVASQAETTISDTRQEILELFDTGEDELTAGQVCEYLPHLEKNTVYQYLRRMRGKELYCPARGRYRLMDNFMTVEPVS